MRSFEQMTLDWVNSKRAQLGGKPLKELPKGYRRDAHGCVIANAFSDISRRVHVNDDEVLVGNFHFRTPGYAVMLIWTFDFCLRPWKSLGHKRKSDGRKPELVYAPEFETVQAHKVMSWRERWQMKRLEREAQWQIAEERRAAAWEAYRQEQETNHQLQQAYEVMGFMALDAADEDYEPASTPKCQEQTSRPWTRQRAWCDQTKEAVSA